MDRLWATWRMGYITGEKESGCVFCRIVSDDRDEENLVLHRGAHCFAVMNLYPYNNGHIMVIPYSHISDLSLLKDEECSELMKTVRFFSKIIKKAINPEGMNIGMNIGRSGGAGIADHLHIHIVPRWTGDSNFMPIIGETRVISEHIKETYGKLRKAMEGESFI